jgi:hypothetical protein
MICIAGARLGLCEFCLSIEAFSPAAGTAEVLGKLVLPDFEFRFFSLRINDKRARRQEARRPDISSARRPDISTARQKNQKQT